MCTELAGPPKGCSRAATINSALPFLPFVYIGAHNFVNGLPVDDFVNVTNVSSVTVSIFEDVVGRTTINDALGKLEIVVRFSVLVQGRNVGKWTGFALSFCAHPRPSVDVTDMRFELLLVDKGLVATGGRAFDKPIHSFLCGKLDSDLVVDVRACKLVLFSKCSPVPMVEGTSIDMVLARIEKAGRRVTAVALNSRNVLPFVAFQ
ncbi:hypothetical protein HBH89_247940 [Parastagonospora nodorum]|nr:hypothetical protein HBH89_247940 [Parastagonospora nodorum]